MVQEDAIMVQAACAVSHLGELKKFESIVEKERMKVVKRLREHLGLIGDIKRDLVRLVANEAEEVKQIGELCEVIRKLNEILDYEKNVGVLKKL